jgi:uncharacterized protein (DUF2336 family)
MTGHQNLIDELESAIARKAIDRHAEMLRRITDLFLLGSSDLSDEQVAMFDNVMSRLIEEVERSARSALATRLLAISNAPPRTIRKLALDDSIEVAGAMLSQCGQLDDETLIEGASTKSQDHLFAISRRPTLSEAITDVLVERGDRHVARSTAENPGARFSEDGFLRLIMRSEHDGNLAHCIWRRPDVPRQQLLTLFATASDSVRLELEAADPHKAGLIQELVTKAADRIRADAREQSAEFKAAYSRVYWLHEAGELSEANLLSSAIHGRIDEISVAFSLMCNLHIGIIERALIHRHRDQIVVLAKSIGLAWETTRAILLAAAGSGGCSPHELDQAAASYGRLQQGTAAKAIQFYRLRERAVRGNLD